MQRTVSLILRRWTLLLALGAISLFPSNASAAPSGSHLLYLIGIRAYVGAKSASMLYQEASGTELDYELARINVEDMELAASELSPWLDQVAAMPAADAVTIADEIVAMRERAASSLKRATAIRELLSASRPDEVEASTNAAPGDSMTVPPELAAQLAARCREIFFDFAIIQRQLKSAETKLGVPLPIDPPVPEGGPQPAR